MLTSEVIFWNSKKQTLIATSTMEAKFVSHFYETSHCIWLKSFIYEFRVVNNNISESQSNHIAKISSHKRTC